VKEWKKRIEKRKQVGRRSAEQNGDGLGRYPGRTRRQSSAVSFCSAYVLVLPDRFYRFLKTNLKLLSTTGSEVSTFSTSRWTKILSILVGIPWIYLCFLSPPTALGAHWWFWIEHFLHSSHVLQFN
jgi:hypothetical protein